MPEPSPSPSPAGQKKVAKRYGFSIKKNGLQKCASCDGLPWTPMGTQEQEKASIFNVF
jgi:hypothetical protein